MGVEHGLSRYGEKVKTGIQNRVLGRGLFGPKRDAVVAVGESS
jgi:hypothetical protein